MQRQLQRRAEELGSRLKMPREQAAAAVKLVDDVHAIDKANEGRRRHPRYAVHASDGDEGHPPMALLVGMGRRGVYTLVSCLRLVLAGMQRPMTITHLAHACDVPAAALAAEYFRIKRILGTFPTKRVVEGVLVLNLNSSVQVAHACTRWHRARTGHTSAPRSTSCSPQTSLPA